MIDFTALGTTEEEMTNLLSKAKVRLFLNQGAAFLASIMGQTEFIWDSSQPTAWTNGLKIGFNPEWFLSLAPDARVTVIAHELWHIAYQHVLVDRIAGRDPERWNIAADHVINLMLEQAKYSFKGLENCYKDPKYMNLTTEQVFNRLPPSPPNSCSVPGAGKQPAPTKPLGSDLAPTPEESQVDVLAKVVQAVQAALISNQAGNIPGEITLMVDKFLNPKLPWRTLLRRFFMEQNKEDFSWKRPNRRHDDIYLPSLNSEDGLTTINYYLDISGSVSDADILRFNSEVAHIKKEFNPQMLNLITFDTRIRDIYSFDENTPFEKIVVTGRGGTDLHCVAAHIKKTKPSVAVIFSDLYVDPMPSIGNIPVIWIVVGNPNAKVPFGKMVHIDNE